MNAVLSAESIIQLTPEAVSQIRLLRNAESDPTRPLRLYVESGGCSGMQYGMTFDELRDGDARVEVDGVAVVVDAFSAPYLKGTVVHYSDALSGGGFKISNPNAKESCGCGKSFQA